MLNRIIFYAIGGLVGLTLVGGAYLAWKSTVEQAALARAAIVQLEEALEEANRVNDMMRKTMELANEVRAELEEEFANIESRLNPIEDGILEFEDRESSEVLKETVRKLRQ